MEGNIDVSELKAYREDNKVIIIMPSEDDAKKLCKIMHGMKDVVDILGITSTL